MFCSYFFFTAEMASTSNILPLLAAACSSPLSVSVQEAEFFNWLPYPLLLRTRCKMLSVGGWRDGWARFHSRNLSNPSAVQGWHHINRPSPPLAGSAIWEDGGGGGQRSALRPVHGNKLSVPQRPGALQEADQWDFPQRGHEDHVRLIRNVLLHCLSVRPCTGFNMWPGERKIKANEMSV